MRKILLFAMALFLCHFSAFAQIPNAGFENWTNNDPDNWSTANPYTGITGVYTCEKGTPGNPGSSYIKLTSKNVPLLGRIIPGVAFSGEVTVDIAAGTVEPKSGFAFAQRPQNLTGSWQYMPATPSDAGMVGLMLTKWNAANNKRDTVAFALRNLTGMAMAWTPFSIPITYLSTDTPDSCMIWMSSSNAFAPVANSYLYVDALAFTGTVSGIANTEAVADLAVYPNPARENLSVVFTARKPEELTLELTDVMGKVVKKIYAGSVAGNFRKDVPVADLAKGLYLLKITSPEATQIKRIVIN